MKNLALGIFILTYASFASICFASGLISGLPVENSEISTGHHQHQEHHLTQPDNCLAKDSSCYNDNIATVMGHAEMYNSITAIELITFGWVLLSLLVLILYCRSLFRQVINYEACVWFCNKTKKYFFPAKLLFLAWTALHTRSPNLHLLLSKIGS